MDGQLFRAVFGWSSRLYLASLTAYLVGQLLDIAVFHALRRATGHRLLWLRATGSTLFSQAIDTLVVNIVLLVGVKSPGFIFTTARNGYLVKVAIAVGLTPMIYAGHALLRRRFQLAETDR